MTWSHIREYISGWARFQKRIHGGKDEETPEEDFPDVTPEEQELLARQMMRRPRLKPSGAEQPAPPE
jgi:hypothetical protein